MSQFLKIAVLLIFTDFYFFPFEFVFLPTLNVKLIEAAFSLPLIGYALARKGNAFIDKDFLSVILFTLPISLVSLLANVVNNTSDYSFNFYFMSVFVWMGAAYFVMTLIKAVHGTVSVQLFANYLIGVCCLQCILALGMEYNPVLNDFINGLMNSGSEAFMGDSGDRMHGLGCALDVAGGRFAAVLVIIVVLLTKMENRSQIVFYICSFYLIAVVGNMIGRTTSIGLGLSFLFCLYAIVRDKGRKTVWWKFLLGSLVPILLVVIWLYNADATFYKNVRFGFEGFFSLIEKGEWETNSTNILRESMVVFPDNMKTWIIGDGYGANPDSDPYYIGDSYHGFYMGTDIGYLRFIFFFGILGTICMLALFFRFWQVCFRSFESLNLKELVTILLLLNLLLWIKATTDLLLIFVILFVISRFEQEEKSLTNC